MASEGSPETLRVALQEAQQRLAFYERCEVEFQEHTGAVIARAAEAVQALERDLREQIQTLQVERDRLLAEVAAAQAKLGHQRTQAAIFVAKVEEQTNEMLRSLQHAGMTIADYAAAHVTAPGAQARFDSDHDTTAASIEVDDAISLQPSLANESPRTDGGEESAALSAWPAWAREIAHPDSERENPSLPRDLVPAGEGEVPSPPLASTEHAPLNTLAHEASEPTILPSDSATATRPEIARLEPDTSPVAPAASIRDALKTVTTHVVLRPPTDPHHLASLRQALEEVPGILCAEVGPVTDASSTLLLTHAICTSPLSILLAVPHLDFRLVGLDDDVVEIEIVETCTMPDG